MRSPRGDYRLTIKGLGASMVSLTQTSARAIQLACIGLIVFGVTAFTWLVFGDNQLMPDVHLKTRQSIVIDDPQPAIDPKTLATRTFQGEPLPKQKTDEKKTKPKPVVKMPSSELFVEGIFHDSAQPEKARAFLNKGNKGIGVSSPLPGSWSRWKVESIQPDHVNVIFEGLKDQLKHKERP